MSLVLNMVGGGGGGSLKDTDAILTVTVLTGSTVTMTKSGITLTPTMWVQAADNTLDCALFVISPSLFDSQNAWTVTATLGTNSASDTVLITTNKEYEITLEYDYYVFMTGRGEVVPMTFLTQPNGRIVSTTENITVSYVAASNFYCYLYNTTAVNLTPYTTLHLVGSTTSIPGDAPLLIVANAPPQVGDFGYESKYIARTALTTGNDQHKTVDVSSLVVDAYVGIVGGFAGVYTELWLER